jgi:hypothetical protein
MVTMSFGKKKFMQPTRRPKHALKVPCFFSFSVLGVRGGGGIFFSHFPASQCVHTMFPSSSQYVLQFRKVFPHTTSLLSPMPWKMVSSFHLYRWAKGEERYTSK